jgi:hypothetical protein
VLLASRTPVGPANLHEERFASTGERCWIRVDVKDWQKIESPTYARAFEALFRLWGDSPFAERKAIEDDTGQV